MKKVLLAGAALMLVSGIASTASAAAVTPGVVLTGDARVRMGYKNDAYDFNDSNADGSQTNMDSRLRLNIKGTAAGGAYAFARIRMMENFMGDMDTDISQINSQTQNNIWVDQAYMGIPFNDTITLEMGKYRSTYGPLPLTYNFFYDDVNSSGARGIITVGDVVINPFVEWMDEAQNATFTTVSTIDRTEDNDEIRFGGHVKAKINKDWTIGGMLGYQVDNRTENTGRLNTAGTAVIAADMNEPNEGLFGSVYVNGKSGAFGLVGELGVTDGDMNGFNNWREDGNWTSRSYMTTFGVVPSNNQIYGDADSIGSNDTGFGGYVFPNYTIDKLNIGLNIGFTQNGFMPDRAFGFVMLGGTDNSWITAQQIGATGDWTWGGLVVSYQLNEALKLTGNLVYADINPWEEAGDGPGFGTAAATSANTVALDSAWELSAVLQYTISKGMDVYLSAGYLDPSLTYINPNTAPLAEDAAFGALTRFELKF
ncbi:hypothetical protein [uncultured Desulfobulbus sp.]|uniref:hypothetical protein n=1 Tax=uncultured Desulfobulbus sp. TaxID=239745 RepID=UPI0029C6FDF1|nr:hypothetical protein [uncultured Desulfobulbus sp.]